MKRLFSRFIPVLTLCAATWAFSSCSDDDDIAVPAPQPTKSQIMSGEYSGRPYMPKVLKLKYSNADLFGKDAELEIDDSCKWARLKLKRVFPGEPRVTVDSLALTPNLDTTELTIAMKPNIVTPGGITFSIYTSTVKEGELSLNISGIKYPANELTEVSNWWQPAPFNMETNTGCIYMLWHVPAGTYVFPNDTGTADTVKVAEGEEYNPMGIMDFIPMLANQILPMFLRDINLDQNAVLRAHYASDAFTGGPTWQYSPAENLCQYYVADGKLRIVLNPEEIMRQIGSDRTKAGAGIDTDLIWTVLGILNQAMTEGLPLQIVHQGDEAGTVTVYLTYEQLKPLFDLLPLLKGALGDLEGMGALVGGMIDMIYNLTTVSDDIEIGLNLIPAERPSDI